MSARADTRVGPYIDRSLPTILIHHNMTAPAKVRGNLLTLEEFRVTCPYCGEQVEIYLEPDVRGTFVQDCEVCCNPWRVRVRGSGDERWVDIGRADGSE